MFPFDIASKQAQIQKYEEEINKQDFWDDNEKAQKILQQNSDLKNIIAEFEGLNSDLEEIEILIERKIIYILISLALGIYENTTSARIVILSTFTSMLRKLRITPI